MKKTVAALYCGFFGLVTTLLIFTPAWASFQIGEDIFDGIMIGPLAVSVTLQGQSAAVMGPNDSTGLFGILLIATVLAAAGLMITVCVKSLILKKDASKQIKFAKMAMGAAFLSSILFATLTSLPGEYDASGEDVQVTDTAGLDTGEEDADSGITRQSSGGPVLYAILSVLGLISLTILTGSGSSTSEETETETETPPSDGDANEPAAASEPATEEAPQRDIKKTLNLVFTVIVVCILAYTVLSN